MTFSNAPVGDGGTILPGRHAAIEVVPSVCRTQGKAVPLFLGPRAPPRLARAAAL